MKITRPDGSTVDVSDDVVALIQKNNKGAGGNRLGVKELADRYPWAAEYLHANGLALAPNGKGGFKQVVTVQCQAGNSRVVTTSKYRGIDSKIPDRIGPARTATKVNYDFNTLKPCTEEFPVATSDLFQTMLCPAHRAEIKSQANALKRQILAEKAKEAQGAIEEAAEPEADSGEETLIDEIEAVIDGQ
jgi:hypothetical protein